jgi:hypothetical protein
MFTRGYSILTPPKHVEGHLHWPAEQQLALQRGHVAGLRHGVGLAGTWSVVGVGSGKKKWKTMVEMEV